MTLHVRLRYVPCIVTEKSTNQSSLTDAWPLVTVYLGQVHSAIQYLQSINHINILLCLTSSPFHLSASKPVRVKFSPSQFVQSTARTEHSDHTRARRSPPATDQENPEPVNPNVWSHQLKTRRWWLTRCQKSLPTSWTREGSIVYTQRDIESEFLHMFGG